MSVEQLITLALSLGGVGALISILVNIGKTTGVIKDGQASTWTTGGNLLVVILLFISGLVKPDLDVKNIDGQVGQVAQILAMLFTLIWPMISSKLTHDALKGAPLVGKSYTIEAQRAAVLDYSTTLHQEG